MTAIKVDLNTEEMALLNRTPESTVLKWAYHTILPTDGSQFAIHAVKLWVHRLVDPIYEHVGSKTQGYTPYDADGRPVTSNEDAIGYTGQFFARIGGRDWTTRTGYSHFFNPGGWEEAYTELFDEESWDLWCSILAKVSEARIKAGEDPIIGTLDSFVEQVKEKVETPDAVDEVIAISVEEPIAACSVKENPEPVAKENPVVAEVVKLERFAATVTDLCERAIDSMMDADTHDKEVAIKQALRRAMVSTTELYLNTELM